MSTHVSVLSMYTVHPYFSLKNWGKKVHIIHGKLWYLKLRPEVQERGVIESLRECVLG